MANPPKKFAEADVEAGPSSERDALLGPDSDDEEDFFLRGPNAKPETLGDSNIDKVKAQLKDVTDTMRQNVVRLNERGSNLEELEDRSVTLSSISDDFRSSSGILRKKARWRKLRLQLIIGLGTALFILIIFLPIIWKSG